jgi:Lon protease-like protein
VLMPGLALPLRIFEPRYRRLLADVTVDGGPRSFGVVALTAGAEVDTGLDNRVPEFAPVGTVAEIVEVQQVGDGTVSVLTGGSRRFRIVRLVDSAAPYLRAEVRYLDELTGTMPDTLPAAALALAGEYARLVAQLMGGEAVEGEAYPTDSILLSYRLASEAPLPLEDRQELLEDDTATARLLHVQRVLRREVVLLRRTRSIAVAPGVLRAVLGAN